MVKYAWHGRYLLSSVWYAYAQKRRQLEGGVVCLSLWLRVAIARDRTFENHKISEHSSDAAKFSQIKIKPSISGRESEIFKVIWRQWGERPLIMASSYNNYNNWHYGLVMMIWMPSLIFWPSGLSSQRTVYVIHVCQTVCRPYPYQHLWQIIKWRLFTRWSRNICSCDKLHEVI